LQGGGVIAGFYSIKLTVCMQQLATAAVHVHVGYSGSLVCLCPVELVKDALLWHELVCLAYQEVVRTVFIISIIVAIVVFYIITIIIIRVVFDDLYQKIANFSKSV
jgi:hypothetical protein